MSAIYQFTVVGAPRTKNGGASIVVKGRPVRLASGPHKKWLRSALRQIPIIRVQSGCRTPMAVPVEVTALWYRDRDRGDEDNYKKALGDFLQKAGIVTNDRLIHWSGDCRLTVDRHRPRIDVLVRKMTLEPCIVCGFQVRTSVISGGPLPDGEWTAKGPLHDGCRPTCSDGGANG